MEFWKKNLWILWVTQVISLMSFGFGLPFMPLYIQELEELTPEMVKLMSTILAATPAITMGIMAPIWGNLADRYGRKLMIVRAMACAVFIIGAMGFVTSVNQLIVLRLLQGLLTGTVTASAAFIGSNTPKKHLTEALGIISSSTFIGYAFGPMIGGVFAKFFGYRVSFILGGIIMAIGVMLVVVLIKEDKSTLKDKHAPRVKMMKNYKKVLMPMIINALTMLFILRISRTIFSPYLALFVETRVAPESVSLITGLLTGLVGISTAAASMNIGKLTNRFNKFTMLRILIVLGIVSMTALTQYKTISLALGFNELLVFSIIYMLFFFVVGGIEPIISSTAAMAVEPSDRGALFGLQGMVGSMAWAVAPMIAGPIVYFQPVEKVLYVVPVVLLISFVVAGIFIKNQEHDIEETYETS